MGFKCGIVGLPNVGKSTLFNALTKTAAAQAANYPFCTIEPNVGIVGVPDPRLYKIAEIAGSKSIIPASMEFVDIAGLVKGASKGEGLGNQFLANIREVEAIIHVLRCFDNEDITHVEGSVDPIRDAEIIETELLLADLERIEKMIEGLQKKIKTGNKDIPKNIATLERVQEGLKAGQLVRAQSVKDEDEDQWIKEGQFLTAKPCLYVCNVDEHDAAPGNDYVTQVKKMAEEKGMRSVMISASIESEIAMLDDEDKDEFIQTIGLSEPGLNKVIRAGYELLDYQTFFTAGPKEARAWTVKRDATAPEAAGRIHTDFEKGFIRAETIAYDDYIAHKGEQGAKEAGKMRAEGKDYKVKDGDVLLFRFNVSKQA